MQQPQDTEGRSGGALREKGEFLKNWEGRTTQPQFYQLRGGVQAAVVKEKPSFPLPGIQGATDFDSTTGDPHLVDN